MKGFTLNGVHSDALFVQMAGKNVPLLPPLKENFENIAGKDGAWDFGVEYDARPIEIDCVILADSTADLKVKLRSLIGYLNPRLGARALVFDDEPDKQYYARLTGQLPLEQIGAFGSFTLQLICPDPFTYSTIEKTVSGSTTLNLSNSGTYYAYPTLTITHGGGAGTLSLSRIDGVTQELTFSGSAPAGDYLVDCKEGTITKDGAGAYQHLSGEFFGFPGGSNTLTVSGGITNVDVKFRDTWL